MSAPRNFNQVSEALINLNGEITVIQTPFSLPDVAGLPRTTVGPIRQALVAVEAVESHSAGPQIGESSVAQYIPPTPRVAFTDLRLAMGAQFSTDFQRLQEVLHRAAGRR